MNNTLKLSQIDDHYQQVCVWPATTGCETEEGQIRFVEFMKTEFKTRVKYLGTIVTKPNVGEPGTGGRSDLFFLCHHEDTHSFAIRRLVYGIRWLEDVVDNEAYTPNRIYPDEVYELANR